MKRRIGQPRKASNGSVIKAVGTETITTVRTLGVNAFSTKKRRPSFRNERPARRPARSGFLLLQGSAVPSSVATNLPRFPPRLRPRLRQSVLRSQRESDVRKSSGNECQLAGDGTHGADLKIAAIELLPFPYLTSLRLARTKAPSRLRIWRAPKLHAESCPAVQRQSPRYRRPTSTHPTAPWYAMWWSEVINRQFLLATGEFPLADSAFRADAADRETRRDEWMEKRCPFRTKRVISGIVQWPVESSRIHKLNCSAKAR